ncbi:hypothetical protein FRC06_008089 [Ceratobasidium sp. 370]|nr:hypothetical protein FRC06_008089 [Ceratobasidium sp. 370]
MSFLQPPHVDAEDTYNVHPQSNSNNRLSQRYVPSPAPPANGPSFPQPVISGVEVPLFSYAPYSLPYTPVRPQLNNSHAQTAPPSALPHARLSPAAAHMQHNRVGASEPRLNHVQLKPVVPPSDQNARRLTPEEYAYRIMVAINIKLDGLVYRLTEDIALRRFHENELHPEDRYWHALVPKSFQQQLSSKEQARQEEIFEIIASEQLYISDLDLWLTVYRDPLPTQNLFAPHVLGSFVKEVFSNIHEIKLRHEILLRALFKTQKRNYRQVHSIMDDLLETVSNAEFQRAYVDYISNIDNAIARHNRETEENPAYAQFVSPEAATARDPRVRKLDFDHFLHRANKRLGQLKLLVGATRKKTELDHFDIQGGSLEMVLRCLHRTVMHGQAKGQGTGEQNALRTFRESLENPYWELADLGLAQEYRAVKYEGSLTQVEPMSTVPLYAVLLDNYLVFTHIVREGSKQKRMVHKPIPLELLDAHLETGPVRTRTRVTSMLSRHDSAQVVRFTVKRNGVNVMQLGARSKTLAEKWVNRMLEEVTLRKFDIDANKRLFFSPKDISSHSLKTQSDIVSACFLTHEDVQYVVCGTTTGVFMGQRDDVDKLRLIRPLLNITKVISIPGMQDLIVLYGGSLIRLSVASLLASNQRTSFLEQTAVELSDPADGFVFAVCGGVIEGRSVVAFTTKHIIRKRLHLYVYNAATRQLDRLCEPIPISDSVVDISVVSEAVFLAGKECLALKHPISTAPSVTSWPDFSPPFVDTLRLQPRCSAGRFLAAIETGPDRILLVYDTHGCFVSSSGQPIPSPRTYEWEITPSAVTYCGQHVALFSHDKTEVRDSEDGRLLQILDMPNMWLLHPLLSYSASEKVLMVVERPDNGFKNLLGELLPTVNISSPNLN